MARRGLEVTVRSGNLEFDKKNLRAVLRSAGAEVAAVARKKIRATKGAGRWYRAKKAFRLRPATPAYRASAINSVPVTVTSSLRKSIKVRMLKSGEGVAIRDHAFYSLFLEDGAQGGQPGGPKRKHRKGAKGFGPRRLLPRRFLSLALKERAPSITARVKVAIKGGIKFVREKA